MSDDDPRGEVRAALDQLADEQVRTLRDWTRSLVWKSLAKRASEGAAYSIGPLADIMGIDGGGDRAAGRARLRLKVDPAWHNPNGVLHGGVIYTLVDYSMGGAVQDGLPEGEYCTTIEAKINYLAPVREGTLTAETTVVKQGRNIAFTESKVTDDRGRLVATASGSMFILRPPPEE